MKKKKKWPDINDGKVDTLDVDRRGVINGSGCVHGVTSVISAVLFHNVRYRQQTRSATDFLYEQSQSRRQNIITVKNPRDRHGEITLRNVTIQLHAISKIIVVVTLEVSYVRQS